MLKFPGTLNFYNFFKSNSDIKFVCKINNYTDSLKSIDIEFKYHEPPQSLKSHKFILQSGINTIEIRIRDMNIEGLKHISKICFVCWNSYITEEEGMFSIVQMQVK